MFQLSAWHFVRDMAPVCLSVYLTLTELSKKVTVVTGVRNGGVGLDNAMDMWLEKHDSSSYPVRNNNDKDRSRHRLAGSQATDEGERERSDSKYVPHTTNLEALRRSTGRQTTRRQLSYQKCRTQTSPEMSA